VMLLQERRPIIALDLVRVTFDAGRFARQGPLPGLGPPIDVCASVERIMEYREDGSCTSILRLIR